MNKLVIVGNGFDLAHGLPTAYKNFIDDFWKNIFVNSKKESIRNLINLDEGFESFKILSEINNYNDFSTHGERYIEWYKDVYDKHLFFNIKKHLSQHNIFYFKNNFFELIYTKNSIENWVDIENEYYSELRIIARKNNSVERENLLSRLNEEFEQIEKLFEQYLISNIEKNYNFITSPDLSSLLLKFFEIDFVFQNDKAQKKRWVNYSSEFKREDLKDLLADINSFKEYDKMLHEGKMNFEDFEKFKKEILFLNFNYTSSLQSYTRKINELLHCKSRELKIHGELNSAKNKMNFGFGDEMDEDYKLIENLNDNEFLKNFKSFKYSQNNNYKNLLDFIDSEKFQIYIFGHSCGLSDRTLLNTIFEHNNCRSIKVFYHQRDDGSDNFTEIIQNISRHFTDKKEMRAKLVNKSLCEPLPQNIRFQKN